MRNFFLKFSRNFFFSKGILNDIQGEVLEILGAEKYGALVALELLSKVNPNKVGNAKGRLVSCARPAQPPQNRRRRTSTKSNIWTCTSLADRQHTPYF